MEITTSRIDGYAPIESYAALGDCRSTALVAPDGAIDWWTLPVMDAPPVLDALLDAEIGGSFTLAPVGAHSFVRRRYRGAGAVLETTYRVGDATVTVTDCLNRGSLGLLPWGELARRVEVEGGDVRMRWRFAPGQRFSGEQAFTRLYHGIPLVKQGDQMLAVLLHHAGEPEVLSAEVRGEFTARPGAPSLVAVVNADAEPLHLPPPGSVLERIDTTLDDWERWGSHIDYDGPWAEAVRRSAMVLRLLTYQRSGAIMAAATTSLPETLDGSKNYDYRFSWVRDSSFALDALDRLGLPEEVHASMSWLLATVSQTAPDIRVFYSIDGEVVPAEMGEVPSLHGYRGATPVHVGNKAAKQTQLGAYGDLLDAVARYIDRGNVLNDTTGNMLAAMVDRMGKEWQHEDAGIWELGQSRHYTTSKISCWSAVDRAISLAEQGQLPGDRVDEWKRLRAEIREFVDTRCWSEQKQAYTFFADGDELDCAVLLAARTGFCEQGDPRLASTVEAIRRELSAGGALLYRYSGMQDEEGAFVACSFWLVEALVRLGRLDEARATIEAMLERTNDVGLLSEQIDPESGQFRGNMPQALSHLAMIGAITAYSERASTS